MALTAALASLLALLTAILVSCTSRINVGLVAIALAWAAGAYARLPAESVLAGFPSSLFITLTGVTLLFSLAEANGTIALVAHRLSSYSSTSGVVLPTFLPTAPRLVEQVGGGDPLAVALSINVGASLVDVSPLSTLGALCVAALPDPANAPDLFRKLLLWGLAMSVVGAVMCWLFAGAFARS